MGTIQKEMSGGIRWRHWALASLAVSLLLIWDGFQAHRPVDGLHEGAHLLYYQSWQAGDLPHVTVRTQYGPFYTYSLLWWLRIVGPTISVERLYFTLVQILGTWTHLMLLRAITSSTGALLIGSILVITHSTAMGIQFGWSNALRTALALAAVIQCAFALRLGGRVRWSLAGLLLVSSLLYSTEYGLAGALGCAVILAHGTMQRECGLTGVGLRWMVAAGGVLGVIFLLGVFGANVPAVIQGALGGDYIGSRLLGHGVIPFKPFPWFETIRGAVANRRLILELGAIWIPAMAFSCFIPWIIVSWREVEPRQRGLSLALLVVAILAQVPVIMRPNVQIAMAMPPFILFGVAWYECARPRMLVASVVTLLCVVNSYLISAPIWPYVIEKYTRMNEPVGSTAPEIGRLGGVTTWPFTADGMREVIRMIEKACAPGERVYVAAPTYAHLCFLADRAGMPPYPLVGLAPTARDRERILQVLKADRPPVALVTLEGIDVPYAFEHREEWEYIQKNYRMTKRFGSLMVFIREDDHTNRPSLDLESAGGGSTGGVGTKGSERRPLRVNPRVR